MVEILGYMGYEYAQRTIELNPTFTGYIHSSDEVLLQWLNVIHLDMNKIWLSKNFYENAKNDSFTYNIKVKSDQPRGRKEQIHRECAHKRFTES